ncbi:MAG: vitamin K epoxide reductase family protein [Thermofilaceae archaeon]
MAVRRFDLFTGATLLGLVLTRTELAFNAAGQSLCSAQGCEVVSRFAQSEILVLMLGTAFWGLLLVLSLIGRDRTGTAVDLLLSAGLAAEGYLLGFQFFAAGQLCYFCLANAACVLFAALVRMWTERSRLVLGFAALLGVLAVSFAVRPGIKPLPEYGCTLLYKQGCGHCEEVLRACAEAGVRLNLLQAHEAAGLMRALGVEEVPVMVCRRSGKIEVLVGSGRILQTLLGDKGTGLDDFCGSNACRLGFKRTEW